MNKRFEGVIPAIITPFNKSGEIDEKLLATQTEYLSSKGVNGFFVNGTTGEGGLLSTEEKIRVFNIVKEVARNRQFICAACIQPSTDLVIKEIKAFEKLKPDYIVVVTPYYYSVDQNTIYEHYRIIAENSLFPIVIYNIPQCTHNSIKTETVLKLKDLNNIIGIKDSSRDFASFSKAITNNNLDHFSWVQGDDYLDGPSLLIGANGIVTGLGNVLIDPYIDMWVAKNKGNYRDIVIKQKLVNNLYKIIEAVPNKLIGAIKAAVSLMGRSSIYMKIPSMALTEAEFSRVKKLMNEIGLI